jgi:hypothetical protein
MHGLTSFAPVHAFGPRGGSGDVFRRVVITVGRVVGRWHDE